MAGRVDCLTATANRAVNPEGNFRVLAVSSVRRVVMMNIAHCGEVACPHSTQK